MSGTPSRIVLWISPYAMPGTDLRMVLLSAWNTAPPPAAPAPAQLGPGQGGPAQAAAPGWRIGTCYGKPGTDGGIGWYWKGAMRLETCYGKPGTDVGVSGYQRGQR
eukprot:3720064-Rhodomonas_salina.1